MWSRMTVVPTKLIEDHKFWDTTLFSTKRTQAAFAHKQHQLRFIVAYLMFGHVWAYLYLCIDPLTYVGILVTLTLQLLSELVIDRTLSFRSSHENHGPSPSCNSIDIHIWRFKTFDVQPKWKGRASLLQIEDLRPFTTVSGDHLRNQLYPSPAHSSTPGKGDVWKL